MHTSLLHVYSKALNCTDRYKTCVARVYLFFHCIDRYNTYIDRFKAVLAVGEGGTILQAFIAQCCELLASCVCRLCLVASHSTCLGALNALTAQALPINSQGGGRGLEAMEGF